MSVSEEKKTETENVTVTKEIFPAQIKNESHFSVVTLAPRKPHVDNELIKKLKLLQMNERKNWQGIDVDGTGRPGTGAMLHASGGHPESEACKDFGERHRTLHQYLLKFMEIQESQQSPFLYKNKYDYVKFRPIKESEILKDHPPSLCYAKGHYSDSSDLLYKILKSDTKMVRSILEANGFYHTDTHDWNILWTSGHSKQYLYEGLNEYQKLNHFPSSYEITRKDRLCDNIVNKQEKFGKGPFYIIPDTYILPDEFADFYAHFHKLKAKYNPNLWIVKPNSLSRGRGIYLIDDISEVPIDESCIVSRYVSNPLLINGLKFDLRIYVLLASLDPLRIYIYNEGLARFATEKYTLNGKGNKYSHLTNYSVNKKNEKFIQNKKVEYDDMGSKWSLSAICRHLEQIGVDIKLLWSKIYDIIIKTFLSAESILLSNFRKNVSCRTNCFELFGFDILIDSDLRPWLMEVNLSPSLSADSPIDMHIKSNLISDSFNLIGLKPYDRKKEGIYKSRAKTNYINPRGFNRKGNFNQIHQYLDKIEKPNIDEKMRNSDLFKKFAQLSPKYQEILLESLDENDRRHNFIRIYPSKGSDIYDQYFDSPRALNKFLHKFLYGIESYYIKINYIKAGLALGSSNSTNTSTTEGPNISGKDGTTSKSSSVAGRQSENHTVSISEIKKNQKVRSDCSEIHCPPLKKGSTFDENNSSTKKSPHRERENDRSSHNASKQRDRDRESKSRAPPIIQERRNPDEKSTEKEKEKEKEREREREKEGKEREKEKEENSSDKLLITGDDILIEYVSRLMIAIKTIKETSLKVAWARAIEKFISHYVWHSSDTRRPENNKLWQRLESRLIEMRERRKRLLKSLTKKDTRLFEEDYSKEDEQKNVIIQGFSAMQLEDMLKTSTKNVAHEVVSCLIETNGSGVLTKIIKWLSTSQPGLINNNHTSILEGNGQTPIIAQGQKDIANGSLGNAETEDESYASDLGTRYPSPAKFSVQGVQGIKKIENSGENSNGDAKMVKKGSNKLIKKISSQSIENLKPNMKVNTEIMNKSTCVSDKRREDSFHSPSIIGSAGSVGQNKTSERRLKNLWEGNKSPKGRIDKKLHGRTKAVSQEKPSNHSEIISTYINKTNNMPDIYKGGRGFSLQRGWKTVDKQKRKKSKGYYTEALDRKSVKSSRPGSKPSGGKASLSYKLLNQFSSSQNPPPEDSSHSHKKEMAETYTTIPTLSEASSPNPHVSALPQFTPLSTHVHSNTHTQPTPPSMPSIPNIPHIPSATHNTNTRHPQPQTHSSQSRANKRTHLFLNQKRNTHGDKRHMPDHYGIQ